MMASNQDLYSAKQAAFISGLDATLLQIALDREYVEATIVPLGSRTYRKFTRDQLLSLVIFTRMAESGIKPSTARDNLTMLRQELINDYASPIEYFIFDGRTVRPVFEGVPVSEFKKSLGAGGWLLPYADTVKHLDREIRNLAHLDRVIEGTEATQEIES